MASTISISVCRSAVPDICMLWTFVHGAGVLVSDVMRRDMMLLACWQLVFF